MEEREKTQFLTALKNELERQTNGALTLDIKSGKPYMQIPILRFRYPELDVDKNTLDLVRDRSRSKFTLMFYDPDADLEPFVKMYVREMILPMVRNTRTWHLLEGKVVPKKTKDEYTPLQIVRV